MNALTPTRTLCMMTVLVTTAIAPCYAAEDEPFRLTLRTQEMESGAGPYHVRQRAEEWDPRATAVILCDVWDYHHCLNAVRRLKEFGPRLNDFVEQARRQGATIIHAPSDCMPAYANHPARTRAIDAPRASEYPADITRWCMRIPAEEQAVYPIDQSDGGEDDDPQEHAAWAAELTAMGRDPKKPWQRQSDMIAIDSERDFISDRGDEVWSILEARGIRNVILAGVHTNMCVLGRPFGLRRMVLGGKRVVLVRDLTDTMYNPAQWPYVSHFTANDFICAHIERHVCPTITSDQLLGDKPFHFSGDRRPHVAVVVAEEGYDTARTLPQVLEFSADTFRVSYAFASEADPNEIIGLSVLDEADVALLSIRRKVLRPAAMDIVRRFVAAGKPIVAIRTTSHAFCLKDKPPPDGYVDWPDFDREVLGGHYHGHLNDPKTATIRIAPSADGHQLFTDIPSKPFTTSGGLYQMSPLVNGTTLLLVGDHGDINGEPVAWTFKRADSGKSFYTSLGTASDLAPFSCLSRLVFDAVYWSLDMRVPTKTELNANTGRLGERWSRAFIPYRGRVRDLVFSNRPIWFRCAVRVPDLWKNGPCVLRIQHGDALNDAWINGHALSPTIAEGDAHYAVQPDWIAAGDDNLVVVRRNDGDKSLGFASSIWLSHSNQLVYLNGTWQSREGTDESWSNMPLPAKFGASPDIVFDKVTNATTATAR